MNDMYGTGQIQLNVPTPPRTTPNEADFARLVADHRNDGAVFLAEDDPGVRERAEDAELLRDEFDMTEDGWAIQ
jgi:hypothetical protein